MKRNKIIAVVLLTILSISIIFIADIAGGSKSEANSETINRNSAADSSEAEGEVVNESTDFYIGKSSGGIYQSEEEHQKALENFKKSIPPNGNIVY